MLSRGFEPVVTVKLQDSRWMTSTGNVGLSTVWPEHLKRRRGLEANVMKGSREASSSPRPCWVMQPNLGIEKAFTFTDMCLN